MFLLLVQNAANILWLRLNLAKNFHISYNVGCGQHRYSYHWIYLNIMTESWLLVWWVLKLWCVLFDCLFACFLSPFWTQVLSLTWKQEMCIVSFNTINCRERPLFCLCDYPSVHQHEYSPSQLSISCLLVISLEIKHFVVVWQVCRKTLLIPLRYFGALRHKGKQTFVSHMVCTFFLMLLTNTWDICHLSKFSFYLLAQHGTHSVFPNFNSEPLLGFICH